MNTETFITFSVVVAILQIMEGLKLRTSQGQLSGLAMAVSTLEFIWLLVCIYALFAINFPDWTILLPAAYLSYFIVVTWHSRTLTKDIETIENVKELRIPEYLVLTSLAFGGFHLLISTIAWLQYGSA
jgi:carbon starvation protein CstA